MASFPVVTDIILCHHFVSHPGWIGDEYAAIRRHHGIVYVLDGCAEYRFDNGARLFARQNDVLYLPQGVAYTTRCVSEGAFVHLTVNFDLMNGYVLFPAILRMQIGNSARFEQLFTSLVHTWTLRHAHYREKCMSQLYQLIYLLENEAQSPPIAASQRLEPARIFLDEHFCEEFPLEILPGLCGMSPTYFRRTFHQVYHESAAEYRRRLRIAKASDLLLSGTYSMEYIAAECGYPDPAYFSRIFKKTMGESPTEYRKNN